MTCFLHYITIPVSGSLRGSSTALGTTVDLTVSIEVHLLACMAQSIYWPAWLSPFTGLHGSVHLLTCMAQSIYWPAWLNPFTGLHGSVHLLACMAQSVYWPAWLSPFTGLHGSVRLLACMAQSIYWPAWLCPFTGLHGTIHLLACMAQSIYWPAWLSLFTGLHGSVHLLDCMALSVYWPAWHSPFTGLHDSVHLLACMARSIYWPAWWRHRMETFSAQLALCAGNSPAPVNSPHKGPWRGALMLSLICVCINGWVNNREAGDLRPRCGHYDANVKCMAQSSYRPAWLGDLSCNDLWLCKVSANERSCHMSLLFSSRHDWTKAKNLNL